MGIKVCQKCRTTNAVGNNSCIRCGNDLRHEKINSKKARGNVYFHLLNQTFNKFLIGGAVISLILILLAVINSSSFHVLSLFGQGG